MQAAPAGQAKTPPQPSLSELLAAFAIIARQFRLGTAAISLASAAIFYRGRINPVWVFAVAALIGLAGLV